MTKERTDETRQRAASQASGAIHPSSYRPAPDVYAALNEYRETFEFRPSYSDIIDRALRMYLRSKGYDLPAEPPDE